MSGVFGESLIQVARHGCKENTLLALRTEKQKIVHAAANAATIPSNESVEITVRWRN